MNHIIGVIALFVMPVMKEQNNLYRFILDHRHNSR